MRIIIQNYLKIIKTFLLQTKGQKRLFLFWGIINLFITNLFLQFILLSYNSIPTSTDTFLSQLINMVLGYIMYSKLVFKNKNLFNKNFIFKYLLLMSIIWLINSFCINILVLIGIIRNLSALILIPFLAIISFLMQKYFVFKTN